MKDLFKMRKSKIALALVILLLTAVILLSVFLLSPKTSELTCLTTTENNNKTEIVVTFKDGKAFNSGIVTTIYGPDSKSKDEEGRKKFEDKIWYFKQTYSAYANIEGYTASSEEVDGVLQGKVVLNYSKLSGETSGLFARVDENIKTYQERLTGMNYICEKKN